MAINAVKISSIKTFLFNAACGSASGTSSHLLVGHYEERPIIVKDATELAPDRPLWRLLAAIGATYCYGARTNNDDDDDCVELTN